MSQQLSKTMARILRHDAVSHGISVTRDGYVDVGELLLSVPRLSSYTARDVEIVVANDSKGRFKLRRNPGLQIKATQGHTIEIPDLSLIPIKHHRDAPLVLHGTSKALIQKILCEGLKKMRRTHIHFAGGERAKSGFPSGTDVIIRINMRSALAGGIEFFKSENGVILSPGDRNGKIDKNHFERVYDRATNITIYPSEAGAMNELSSRLSNVNFRN